MLLVTGRFNDARSVESTIMLGAVSSKGCFLKVAVTFIGKTLSRQCILTKVK
jgi:hypothetical protein